MSMRTHPLFYQACHSSRGDAGAHFGMKYRPFHPPAGSKYRTYRTYLLPLALSASQWLRLPLHSDQPRHQLRHQPQL